MEPDGNLLADLLVLLILTALHAFFTMCDIAVVALNDAKLKKMAQNNDKAAKRIIRLVKHPSRFAAALRLGFAVSGFLMAFLAAHMFLPRLAAAFGRYMPQRAAGPFAFMITAFMYLILTIALGEMAPRKIAAQHCEKIAFAFSLPLLAIFNVLRPIAAACSVISGVVVRLFGIDPDSGALEVTKEEIRMLLDEGEEHGSIEESEKEMIHNIFDLDDRPVIDVMTHRTEVVFLDEDAAFPDVVGAAVGSGHSRIPVCGENGLDSIIGILYVKDLLGLMQSKGIDRGFSIKKHIRAPLYVLESNTCMEALSEFKAKKIHMAVVVDEYGGTSGVVTMEDLLESIVGSIQDEYDEEDDREILEISENTFFIDGLTPLPEIDKRFGLALAEEAEFDTIGGYVINMLERLPPKGENPSVEIGGYIFTVSEADDRRVISLKAKKLHDRD